MGTTGLGKRGEQLAERFLRRKGYRILARNYRCPCGEIDLVARDGDTLVFVEIKGRSGGRFGSPLEAVTVRKQERMAVVARHFLSSCRIYQSPARFDVIGIRWRGGAGAECVLVRDAFRLTH